MQVQTTLLFMIWLLVQSACETGIFLASEGTIHIRPDGKKDYTNAMLLAGFRRWVERHDWERVYYCGDQLKNLMNDVVRAQLVESILEFGRINYNLIVVYGNDRMERAFSPAVRQFLISSYGVHISREQPNEEVETHYVNCYKMIKDHALPLWLRKPLIGCVTCMASLWSLPLYALPALIVFGWQWEWFALLPVNIGCVAFLNTYFYKRAK